MTDVLDGVRSHYRATGLIERLKGALAAFGPEHQALAPERLGPLDQFHTRGLAATTDLARLAGIEADMTVLDVGSGIGGAARILAGTYRRRGAGGGPTEPLLETPRRLTRPAGPTKQGSVTHRHAHHP